MVHTEGSCLVVGVGFRGKVLKHGIQESLQCTPSLVCGLKKAAYPMCIYYKAFKSLSMLL